jgi:hypothetical protein
LNIENRGTSSLTDLTVLHGRRTYGNFESVMTHFMSFSSHLFLLSLITTTTTPAHSLPTTPWSVDTKASKTRSKHGAYIVYDDSVSNAAT